MEKWNDRTFSLLVRRGPEGFKLFLFSKKGPERTVEILIQFPFVDMRPPMRRYPICLCFSPLLLYIFLRLQFTCTHLSNEMEVLEREVFWLTILRLLNRLLADMLEVHQRIEEITDTQDLHIHAATSPFEVLTALSFLFSVEFGDHNYLP